MPDTQYTTACIPKDVESTQLDALAEKFRDFKINALRTAPEAFSAELDVESQLPHSTWLSRITEPNTTILICVATSTDILDEASADRAGQLKMLLDGQWTGMFTMIGPVSRHDYIWPESGQPEPGPEDSETRWQLTSLFTLPTYRGCGIAKRLTEGAIESGKLASAELERVSNKKVWTRVRLVVHPKNTGVVKMYEKFGFVDSARMTVAEACVANGAGDMVPKDADPEKWHSRFGVAMEIVV
jgi:ribosomal protein S18 acetylase RimI-like enzyme